MKIKNKDIVEEAILAAVDPGIRDVVARLRQDNIRTFASCQGGEYHSFERPIVRIHYSHNLKEIAKSMKRGRFSGYYIKPYYYNGNKLLFWEVEFDTEPNNKCKIVYANHIQEELDKTKKALYFLLHKIGADE